MFDYCIVYIRIDSSDAADCSLIFVVDTAQWVTLWIVSCELAVFVSGRQREAGHK